MKKVSIMVMLACAGALTAYAAESESVPYQTLRLGISVDYSWAVMEQVNKQLSNGTNVANAGSGFTGILDLNVYLARFLMVGARAGYISLLPAKASYGFIVPAIYDQTTTNTSSLIPLEVGLSLNIDVPATPLSLMAGIYVGYGFALASLKNDITALGQSTSFTQPYNGGNFVGELPASVNFRLSNAVSVNINGAYRLARMPHMVQSQDVSYNGIPGVSLQVGSKGDVLKDSDDNDLVFDFSGFSVGVGLSLGF